MTEPTYTCTDCGRVVAVDPFARGFPPDAARRKLTKLCQANGCSCPAPRYRAGIDPRLLRPSVPDEVDQAQP